MDSLTQERQEDLINSIETSHKAVLKNLSVESKYKNDLKQSIKNRTKFLKNLAKENHFIDDQILTQLVDEVTAEIKTNNPRDNFPVRVLVSRSHEINAFCLGEGTVVINLGLISSLNSHDELAFVIAHEMAHELLDHVNIGYIEALKRRKDSRTLKEQLKEGGNLYVIKKTIYKDYKYTYKNEVAADILAIELLMNTKYNWTHYHHVFSKLDSSDYPIIRKIPDLQHFFNFSKYPFKDKWLETRESIFSQSNNSMSFLNEDSIKSHPDISKRRFYLDSLYSPDGGNKISKANIPFSTEFKNRVNMELVESTYKLGRLSFSLFLALQRLEIYPDSKYLKQAVSRILVDLYFARKEHKFGKYVAQGKYPKLTEELHVFLNNLRLSEIGNIAYHYINQVNIFDKNNEESYHQLWRVSKAIGKQNTVDSVVSSYLKLFPNGKYSTIFNQN